jgi:sulfur transfer complex TusBCD TusB component (DsrH family)
MICPIVISTLRGQGLAVLLESIKQYAPECPVYLRGPESVIEKHDAFLKIYGQARNFGNDYNHVIGEALKDWNDCIVANDDIVLTPDSVKLLMEDVQIIKSMNSVKAGWIASRSDAARPCQNVRICEPGEKLHFYKFSSENFIRMAEEVSPIFAYITKDAFGEGFPPLNWYSDDVHCRDLIERGYSHLLLERGKAGPDPRHY